MTTPDIRRETIKEAVLHVLPYFDGDSFHYHLEEKDTERLINMVLHILTDREAEIVAGIEGRRKRELYIGWNEALDDIATKITKGEI